ncbi:MAG: aldo/keto reductase [Alphaproteobacteria bacterium]|nr:aldo/keto reductase [Alphaproteobacteria bacterium]MBU1513591.1 aldo/keto reductase [Alphaproteobacteria bacterium]MBU2094764.1 aldo/keto reductase [Alphaproteobacteria bacterium]MBU2150167.1 aldo/keto reductase [Alphaproteobacteria bacterium]MBU2309304.1 aldo/keto reductase [Alphaproteobacteria bacterium]
MRYRALGDTGLTVSELGFGCASWWGKPRFAEATAVGLVHQALDRGVTLFDTGASYSAGEAEPRLGRALKGRDTSRLVVATKAGTYHAGGGRIARDMSPAAIAASAERSLTNLGLETLGLLQLHGPSIPELEAAMETLAELKRRGLIRAAGLNSFDPAVIAHAVGLAGIDVVMVDYNVLRPEREPLIARAAAAGKGVLAGMPLAMGHTRPLLDRLRGPQDLWYAARALAKHRVELTRGAKFRFLHRLPDMSGSQAALTYVLANPGVSAAVFGATRPEHLAENLAASGLMLPNGVTARIRAAQKVSP